ncbi:MAG TPA: flagellar hook protein FlgE [Bryobacteraceae bacterium]|jgi:flagellar hook protein FlgE|nr:flagellar hook protein FlgE [Bryobacteraceae bacterium]
MFTSFSTALSALAAQSTAIDVVGNNLANLNTTGFKSSAVSFHDLVTESLGAGLGDTQVGFGVGTPITLRQFSQGAIQTTGGTLDAAIQGDGFFVVQGPNGATEYTRAGSFQVDKDGNLITTTGEAVEGWTMVNAVLNTNAPPGNITIPVGTVQPPVTSKNMSFDMNLNAAGVPGTSTGTFATSVTIFDSLGNSHIVTATFTEDPTTAGQWNYSIIVPDADLKTPPFTPLTGSITFNANGVLTTPAATDPPPQLQITGLKDGASDMTINWNLFNGTSPRVTQYAQPSSISAIAQDGNPPAQLIRVAVADAGQILAQYSNGQQTVVGQLAMATVRNPESLIAVGDNNYQLSARSALPAVGLPGTGGRGAVQGGAVESSTVDIAKEFTNLIVYQRGYEANSKIINAVDSLSQTTINLIH